MDGEAESARGGRGGESASPSERDSDERDFYRGAKHFFRKERNGPLESHSGGPAGKNRGETGRKKNQIFLKTRRGARAAPEKTQTRWCYRSVKKLVDGGGRERVQPH